MSLNKLLLFFYQEFIFFITPGAPTKVTVLILEWCLKISKTLPVMHWFKCFDFLVTMWVLIRCQLLFYCYCEFPLHQCQSFQSLLIRIIDEILWVEIMFWRISKLEKVSLIYLKGESCDGMAGCPSEKSLFHLFSVRMCACASFIHRRASLSCFVRLLTDCYWHWMCTVCFCTNAFFV